MSELGKLSIANVIARAKNTISGYAKYGADTSKIDPVVSKFQQDAPKIDSQVDTLTKKYAAAGIEGLGKYDNIQNPYTRRGLAEKYQSVAGKELQGVVDEQTRRENVLNEYVSLWEGTYGAEAVKAMQGPSAKEKSLFGEYITESLKDSFGQDEYSDPQAYNELKQEAMSKYGMTSSQFDSQYAKYLSPNEQRNLGIITNREFEDITATENQRKYTIEQQAEKQKQDRIDKKTDEVYQFTADEKKDIKDNDGTNQEYLAYKYFKAYANKPDLTFEEYKKKYL